MRVTGTGDFRDLDRSFEKHTCFYFYHKYKLTQAACEELDLAGFADSSTGEEESEGNRKPSTSATSKRPTLGVVPPPPKAPERNDVIVGLILRNQQLRREEVSPEADVDVSVDVDDDDLMGGTSNSRHDLLSGRQDDEADEAHVSRAGATPRRTPRTPRTPSHMREIKTPTKPIPPTPPAESDSSVAGVSTETPTPAVDELCLVSPPYICNPSPFAELVGWGRNSAYLFDKSLDKLKSKSESAAETAEGDEESRKSDPNYVCFNPANIAIPPSVNLERVYMVACSHRHMLLLTYNGSVYSCGDNTEGALGLGDSFNRSALTLILWPLDSDVSTASQSSLNPLEGSEEEPGGEEGQSDATRTEREVTSSSGTQSSPYKRIVYVAAGSSAIGSHSMALSEDGNLYGWGVPYATGHGVMDPSLSPKLIEMPSPPDDDDASVPPEGTAGEQLEGSAEVPPPPPARVKHVACGGGFTVAVLTTGHVASFGMWAHGRLGLGPAPISKLNRGSGAIKSKAGRKSRKVVRYQLKPKIVPGIKNAVKVSKRRCRVCPI